MKRRTQFLIGLAILALIVAGGALLLPRQEREVQARLIALPAEAAGFARADGPRPLRFPADHGPHPDYQTEWWYYTGNLETTDRRHLGYQLTFFRRALIPVEQQKPRASHWAAEQVYMAHFALTDVAAKNFGAFERFSRGAAGLAGAQAAPFNIWLEDWQVQETEPGIYRLYAAVDGLTLDLYLVDEKGPVLQGDRGYSQKGPDPGNASYYYSQSRLLSSGRVQIDGAVFEVSGSSWMDHEFSTSALSPDQVGWDWFALQLDDGSELMVFHIRRTDGSVDPFSAGTLIQTDGTTRHLGHRDYAIRVEDTWRSPHSGAVYPARWSISLPALDLDIQVVPHLSDQELNVSYTYWEGAVFISGMHAGRPVSGDGYVELTGYAGSMQGQF